MDSAAKLPVLEFCAGALGLSEGVRSVEPSLQPCVLSEIEAYAVANLVAKMEAGLVEPAPVWSDLKTFPVENFRRKIWAIFAGYPCQPFSQAGERRGTNDPRHLWPDILRAIDIIRPAVVFLENVEGHVSLGLREVLADLAGIGYRVENSRGEPTFGLFSAAEAGSSHQRKRVFILAVDHAAWDEWDRQEWQGRPWRGVCEAGNELADTNCCGRSPELGEQHQKRREVATCASKEGVANPANHHRRSGIGRAQEGTRPGECGWRRPSGSCADVAYSGCKGLSITKQPGEPGASSRGSGVCRTTVKQLRETRLPAAPPGPEDTEAWERILAVRPDLAPAIEPGVCRVVDGLAVPVDRYRLDRLRLGGNGVHRAAAAKAWVTLWERMAV